MTIYATRRDAIEREILPALGEYADAHDIDAIVDACFEYGPGGYVQTVDTEQFWQYVEAAAIEQT